MRFWYWSVTGSVAEKVPSAAVVTSAYSMYELTATVSPPIGVMAPEPGHWPIR